MISLPFPVRSSERRYAQAERMLIILNLLAGLHYGESFYSIQRMVEERMGIVYSNRTIRRDLNFLRDLQMVNFDERRRIFTVNATCNLWRLF